MPRRTRSFVRRVSSPPSLDHHSRAIPSSTFRPKARRRLNRTRRFRCAIANSPDSRSTSTVRRQPRRQRSRVERIRGFAGRHSRASRHGAWPTDRVPGKIGVKPARRPHTAGHDGCDSKQAAPTKANGSAPTPHTRSNRARRDERRSRNVRRVKKRAPDHRSPLSDHARFPRSVIARMTQPRAGRMRRWYAPRPAPLTSGSPPPPPPRPSRAYWSSRTP